MLRVATVAAVFATLAPIRPPLPRAKGVPASVVVFEASNTTAWPCFRVPSAVAIPGTDRVLAFAECRKWAGDGCVVAGARAAKSAADMKNRSICARISNDGGATWGELNPNITQVPSANPSAVFDVNKKRITVSYDNTITGGIALTHSDDLGETWGRTVPARFPNGSAVVAAAGPGNGLVLLPGSGESGESELNLGIYNCNRFPAQPNHSFGDARVISSRDGGRTWTSSSRFAHLGEPSLTALPRGELLLDTRCPDGRKYEPGPAAPCSCDCRATAVRSANGVWSDVAYDKGVPDPSSQGAVLGLGGGRVAFTNPSDRTERKNLTLQLGSVRAGSGPMIAFDDAVPISGGEVEAMYSALYATRSGGIGVLWESQGDVPLSQCNDTGVYGNESGKPGACQIRLSIVNT